MDNTFFIVDDFSCGYTNFKLDGISFKLNKGSFTGIIGPNGSGKTTFFRGITHGIPTLNGSLLLGGKKLSNLTLKERARQIAIVSQFQDLDPIKVEDYVLMGRIHY